MKKRAQVWVETVIYTLIAFAMIGAVLMYARPKIQEAQDRTILEQSEEILRQIDLSVEEIISGGTGNSREILIGIKKGILKINSQEDKIIFELSSDFAYSEPEVEFEDGNIIQLTKKDAGAYKIILTLDYSAKHDLTHKQEESDLILTKSPTEYKLLVKNSGETLDFSLI